ncbi:hypothetical protein GC177_09785 [bacterium]|nr:hypothetical protein [bacterium]
MSTKLITALAFAGTTLILVACSSNNHPLPPEGKYKSYESSTDANGTTYTTEKTTKVDRDDDGDKKAVVKTKTTKDPKGWFNKETTSESKKVIEEDR